MTKRSENELISRPIQIITLLLPSRKSLRNKPWTLSTPTTSRASTLKQELGYHGTYETLMAYLVHEFGKKTQKELDANELELKQPWNAIVPIQALFLRVDKCRRFDPTIPEANIVCIIVAIICTNKGFGEDYKEWLAMRDVDKTWVNLKTHFRIADKARRELNLIQDPSSVEPTTYPGSAHSATGTPPPTQVELLTKAVDKLVKALVSPGGVAAAAAAAAAATGGATAPTTPRPHTPVASNPAGGREPTDAEAATMSYCWSHGFCPRRTGTDAHTSATCTRHRIGHESTATAANKMGGETRICNSWPSTWTRPAARRQQQRE